MSSIESHLNIPYTEWNEISKYYVQKWGKHINKLMKLEEIVHRLSPHNNWLDFPNFNYKLKPFFFKFK